MCPEPSFLCVDLGACATCEGTCLCLATVDEAEVALEDFDPVADTQAPVMKLLGDGKLAQIVGSGTLVMLDYINVGTIWTDPGVTVTDNIDLEEDVRRPPCLPHHPLSHYKANEPLPCRFRKLLTVCVPDLVLSALGVTSRRGLGGHVRGAGDAVRGDV
jgi:hypothetical protein